MHIEQSRKALLWRALDVLERVVDQIESLEEEVVAEEADEDEDDEL